MRAVTIDEYGATPHLADVQIPKPGPTQVLVHVDAAGMNPMDLVIAAGGFDEVLPGTFPMVLGADLAGRVETVGGEVRDFTSGEEIFGQLLVAPMGSSGTYAEWCIAPADAPLAKVPEGMDPVVAASLPTAGGTALDIVDALEPLAGKTVLVVGAGGGVGSFATQLAANADAHVIADAAASDAERLRGYGAAETLDYKDGSVADAVRRAHPDGVDALVDVASDAPAFAALAALVRRDGIALTTKYVADTESLAANGVRGVNFRVQLSSALLTRLAEELVSGRVTAPPITRVKLDDTPKALSAMATGGAHGKTVVIP